MSPAQEFVRPELMSSDPDSETRCDSDYDSRTPIGTNAFGPTIPSPSGRWLTRSEWFAGRVQVIFRSRNTDSKLLEQCVSHLDDPFVPGEKVVTAEEHVRV